MKIRNKIIKEALTWLGTPYHHQAMVKGVGVDCAMFVMQIAKHIKVLDVDAEVPVYSTEWHIHNKEEKLLEVLENFNCEEINKEDVQPGDIVTFKFGLTSSHLAILLPDNKIIHAHLSMKKVVQHEFDSAWLKRFDKAYKFPGVIDV